MRVYKSKIVACGDAGAGKRTMIATRDAMTFPIQMIGIIPVIRVFHHGEDEIYFNTWIADEKTVKNETMKRLCFTGSSGVIIVVDTSLGNRVAIARKWIDIYRSSIAAGFPSILVGTKVDAIPEHDVDVATRELENVAKKNGLSFVQTSSVLGMNVDKPFCWLIDSVFGKEF